MYTCRAINASALLTLTRQSSSPRRNGIETLVDMIFANAPCYDSSLLNEAIRASWRFHDDLWTRKRPQCKPAGRWVVTSYERPRTLGLEWNFPQVARDRCEFNLFGSRLPRQRHELERGYCCFAHHAKRSNRFARTRVGHEGRDRFARGSSLACGCGGKSCGGVNYRGPWRQDWRLHG